MVKRNVQRAIVTVGTITMVCSTIVSLDARQRRDVAPPQCGAAITIRTVGGLLGQIEGFCEDPGGTYDWPLPSPATAPLRACHGEEGEKGPKWLGGAMGVRRLLASKNQSGGEWLIVTGNNQPPRPGYAATFWHELGAMNPDVVALGPEDFYRTLRKPHGSAQALSRWTRSSGLPLLASNVVVRKRAKSLNVEEGARGYKWHVDEDVSVSWFDSLALEHPRDVKLQASLEEFAFKPKQGEAGTPSDARVAFEPGKNGADGRIVFARGLRPGRWYRVSVSSGAERRASLVFATDAALTPIENAPPALAGFPVRADEPAEVMAVALIDPGTQKGAAPAAWKWSEGGSEHEIHFADPKKTLEALLNRGAQDERRPVVILVSALSDEDTAEMIATFPEVRFIILPPESTLLARASRESSSDPAQRFSGDLGFRSIIDEQYPVATKVMVRPEWFGETMLTVKAAKAHEGQKEWRVQHPTVEVDVVSGAELIRERKGSDVLHTARFENDSVSIDTSPAYTRCPATGGGASCEDFAAIWSDRAQFLAVLGESLRERLDTDLTVLSTDVVDEDYAEYVKRYLKPTGPATISRYILERLVYLSPRIVKAFVAGDALAATLQKLVTANDTLCITGLAAGCPTSLDVDHPERIRVNGRNINPRLIYAVALPDSLAEEFELSHNDEAEPFDLVETADDYLIRGRWSVRSSGQKPVGARLEERRDRRPEGYLAVTTLDVGFVALEPRDPPGRSSVRENLGVEFSGAKRTRTVSVSLDSDMALLDMPRFAIRLPLELRYARRKETDRISYDADRFSAGLRVDAKFGIMRPFAGYFVDGQLAEHIEEVRASRPLDGAPEGFTNMQRSSFATSYTVEPRRFSYRAAGVDVLALKQFPLLPGLSFTVQRLGARVGFGREENVPASFAIGGEEQDLDRWLEMGSETLVNEYFGNHPTTFTPETAITVGTAALEQRIIQGDADFELKWNVRTKEYTAGAKLRHRWQDSPGRATSPFRLTSEFRAELTFGVPLWWRLKLTPAYTFEQATIEAEADDRFRFHRVDVKVSLPVLTRYWGVWLMR